MTSRGSQTRLKLYTLEDVEEHRTAKDCWVVRNGNVYDVSGFLEDHPGGEDYILEWAGKDVTEIMKTGDNEHSDSAYEMLSEYLIGRIGADAGLVTEGAFLCFDFDCTLLTFSFRLGSDRGFPSRRYRCRCRLREVRIPGPSSTVATSSLGEQLLQIILPQPNPPTAPSH